MLSIMGKELQSLIRRVSGERIFLKWGKRFRVRERGVCACARARKERERRGRNAEADH